MHSSWISTSINLHKFLGIQRISWIAPPSQMIPEYLKENIKWVNCRDKVWNKAHIIELLLFNWSKLAALLWGKASSCTSLWTKASAKWLNVNVNVNVFEIIWSVMQRGEEDEEVPSLAQRRCYRASSCDHALGLFCLAQLMKAAAQKPIDWKQKMLIVMDLENPECISFVFGQKCCAT